MRHTIPIRQIQGDSPKAEHFRIRTVEDLLAGKDMVQKLHRHDFYFILVLEKGNGTHEIDFTSYPICNHSVFFLRPGQVHQLDLKANSTGFLMEFKPDFCWPSDASLQLYLRRASAKNFCQPDSHRISRLLSILTSVFQEYTNTQEHYLDAIKANLSIFFIEFIRSRQNQQSTADVANAYAQERVEEFTSLLETHMATHKQVSYYADLLNLSPYQLNTITKAVLGKTCSEVINEHIILESKRYLLATSDQVTRIAYQLGYEDPSYFIRFFKRHTGYSPEAFRHNFR